MATRFFCKLYRIIKFFFFNLLREATFASTKRNSSAFLLQPSKTFFNVVQFSIFSQTFLVLIFAFKIKTMLLNKKKTAVLFTSYQKNIAYVSEHLIYCIQINEYCLNKNACLNIIIESQSLMRKQVTNKVARTITKFFEAILVVLLACVSQNYTFRKLHSRQQHTH